MFLVLDAINFPCRIAQQLFGNGNDSANIGKCFNSNKTLWIAGTFGIEHFGRDVICGLRFIFGGRIYYCCLLAVIL